MKKLIALLFLLPSLSFAAGTVTVTRSVSSYSAGGTPRYVQIVNIDWVADASAATVPDTNVVLNGFVQKVVTNPGSTAPTANYDIAFGDPEDSALDALAGTLANRHTTTTEQVYPAIAGTVGTVSSFKIFLKGTYVFQLTNNAVNSATGRVQLWLTDQP